MSQIAVLRCPFMLPEWTADAEGAGRHPDEVVPLRPYPSLRLSPASGMGPL